MVLFQMADGGFDRLSLTQRSPLRPSDGFQPSAVEDLRALDRPR